jgi:hypothetical protein
VTNKGALLTQVLKVDEQAKKALINLDLVLADEADLVRHEGFTVSLVLHDGDWQSQIEALHSEFSKHLEQQLSTTLFRCQCLDECVTVFPTLSFFSGPSPTTEVISLIYFDCLASSDATDS